MRVRRFEKTDAEEVSALIVTTLRTTNIKDYSAEYIENDVNALQPNNILERAGWVHFYVVCDDEKIVGCGAIGPYWGKENESSLFTIFPSSVGTSCFCCFSRCDCNQTLGFSCVSV